MLEVRIKGTRGNPSARYAFDAGSGITAVVGPSGAGKTSLLRVIAGLDRPLSGTVSLGGVELADKAEQRQIGMVFQEPRLLPHYTVEQNIELGRRGDISARQLADQLGIADLFDRFPSSLSGGEKQRVMIARALFGAPKLMLFDEPLSAIDPRLKGDLLSLIRRSFSKANIPVLYVTHQMDEAAQLAQNLITIDLGEIVAQGPLAQTMAQLDGPAFFENGITSLLSGSVSAIDDEFDLATIGVGTQQVDLPRKSLNVGDQVCLRIWARDVLLAKERLTGVSARNQLHGEIETIRLLDRSQADVLVRVEGDIVRARVMAKTIADLQMTIGQSVYVIFKSASVE